MLSLVSTPIGNLGDISARAREVLSSADIIACEDTRQTGKLLSLCGIEKAPGATLHAYHEHNESAQTPILIQRLQAGAHIALVSDAGTPAVSDPGFRLVRAARAASLPVSPVPGACAAIAALSASGLPTHQFHFYGFLAPKTSARKKFFTQHAQATGTIILYESCHRIEKSIADIIATLGPVRTICVCAELTKKHERFWVGPAESIQAKAAQASKKGEFVVLIAPEGYVL